MKVPLLYKYIFAFLIGLLIIGGIYAIFFLRPSSNDVPREQTPIPKNAPRKVFKIKGGNYYYDLKEIKVKLDDVVRIEFTNVGGTHDWGVDEFNARTEMISAGQTAPVEFVTTILGKFVYYCSYTNHRQLGQAGMLIVEDK